MSLEETLASELFLRFIIKLITLVFPLISIIKFFWMDAVQIEEKKNGDGYFIYKQI